MTPADDPIHPTLVLDDTRYETAFTRKYAERRPHLPKDPKRLTAIIPGLILPPIASPGDRVRVGQDLLILEAMKMENHISAHDEVTVKAVHVGPGDLVTKGQLLMEFD